MDKSIEDFHEMLCTKCMYSVKESVLQMVGWYCYDCTEPYPCLQFRPMLADPLRM